MDFSSGRSWKSTKGKPHGQVYDTIHGISKTNLFSVSTVLPKPVYPETSIHLTNTDSWSSRGGCLTQGQAVTTPDYKISTPILVTSNSLLFCEDCVQFEAHMLQSQISSS